MPSSTNISRSSFAYHAIASRKEHPVPYTHKKLKNGKIGVFKKADGKKVGETTPAKLNSYLAALHIHSKD